MKTRPLEQFCSEFRKRHGVSDAQHADALKAIGDASALCIHHFPVPS